jgi:hypothetical protein
MCLHDVTGIALLFYMQMMFVPLRKHTYQPPRPVNSDTFNFYMQMMFIPNRKHTYVLPWYYGDSFTFL